MRSYKCYIAIDLKSFYASVECRERGLDPLTTHLVVADAARTEKTICLAVSPSLKAYGVGGRARLFEVVQRVREVNGERLRRLRRGAGRDTAPLTSLRGAAPGLAPLPSATDLMGRDLEAYRPFDGSLFSGASFDDGEVRESPWVELDYLVAKPRMALYLDYSTRVYKVYLRYFAPEDIHVYSIDEVLIDATGYLRAYGADGRALASEVVEAVRHATGLTATAGIGTNLYLAKVAMDILAKHEPPDERGVRCAFLDEGAYRRRLWDHRPLTDFWRVGPGTARRLESHGMHTMGDVARCSLGDRDDLRNEELLFRLFGKNAELLIDHAWGVEPVTMEAVKAYEPQVKSTMAGQVLQCPYSVEDARLVVWEMADQLALDLRAAAMETDKLTLTLGYDRLDPAQEEEAAGHEGGVDTDRFGRRVPKHGHGTRNLKDPTASSRLIAEAVLQLYDELADPRLKVRRINIGAEQLVSEEEAAFRRDHGQMRLFEDPDAGEGCTPGVLAKERQMQGALLQVRDRFGKNAVFRAASLQEGATARQRNGQIGGHSA